MVRTVFFVILILLFISGCSPKVNLEDEEVYEDFFDGDFFIKKPTGWSELQDEAPQRILGVSKGVCSVIVDKHNALPKDVYNWIDTAIKEKPDQDLLSSSIDGDIYYFSYNLPYEQYNVTANTKVFYCNYQSYIVQVLCVNEMVTPHFEEARDYIIDSSKCMGEYEVPSPLKIEEQKEEVKSEEPEVIEEIEEEIVQTNVGEEFGIDEEMVVYFINGNEFFRKIMKDFPESNIVVEDDENNRELKLKVDVDSEGYITFVEDGEHSDPDVTLLVPLADALNIFGNAQNINPVTLIGFAINVRTEPPEIKNQVIQKVLRGEYN